MDTNNDAITLRAAACALCIVFAACFLAGCSSLPEQPSGVMETPRYHPYSPDVLGAGFRYSVQGPLFDPGPRYWVSTGKSMASRFGHAVPQAVWIVSHYNGKGTRFTFPGTQQNENILFSSKERNEEALNLFDRQGIQVWLQIEPGQAPVDELIRIVLDRYGHHPCVIGIGIDLEWFCTEQYAGEGFIADEDAMSWVRTIRSFNPDYWLFLKHWEKSRMPPGYRDGIVFVDDGQQFDSLESMMAHFTDWGKAFYPAPVAFQYGYPSDRVWWEHIPDPADEIGRQILACVPNAGGLFWVDFTVLDVFPPVHNYY
jgi:hypothetical protein